MKELEQLLKFSSEEEKQELIDELKELKMENKTAFDIIRQEKYLYPKKRNPEDTFFCQKHAIEAMEEYGKQQYNQAIKDAAENAKAFFFYDDFDGSPEFGVNKDSILKLVKP